MKQRSAAMVLTVALCALCAGGGLVASNMALEINYQLTGPAGVGGRGTGMNTLSLPYIRRPGVDNAYDLMLDIGNGDITDVLSVSRFKESSDSYEIYTGRMGSPLQAPFPLVSGEGLFVQMAANVNYVSVGDHDPFLSILLETAGVNGSNSGKNFFALPYNTTVTDGQSLAVDIGGPNPRLSLFSVARFLPASNSFCVYIPTPRVGGTPCLGFSVVVGEAYFVAMKQTVSYTPSHF